MKKIVLNVQNGVDKDLIAAAQEAIEEFVSMFPEYKNSFKIELRKDQDIRDFHNSLGHMIAESRDSERPGEINAAKLTALLGKQTHDNNLTDEIPVCLVNDCIFDKKQTEDGRDVFSPCFGLQGGVTDESKNIDYDALVVSAKSCGFDKELIKTIFIHEMGHIFNATHQNRAHTIEHNGSHCTNDLCIMGDSNYPELNKERLRRKARGKPPFCDDCIASMREYLSHMPGVVREVNVQPREETNTPRQETPPQVVNRPEILRETLPVLPHNDRSWKKDLRTFYKQVANDNEYEYKEELLSENYLARMKRKDGSILNIEANNEYNVALGAKDANGDDAVPSVEDMRDLVNYAKSKKSSMNFGKDNEPEFNARLMIACLEAEPPLKMRHAPKINEAFLSQLDKETKDRLQKLLHSEEKENEQQRPATTKTFSIGESR